VLIFEYHRQSNKEHLKEELIMQEKAELQAMLNELAFQAERQDTQIRELTRIIADLGNDSIHKTISMNHNLIIYFLDSKSWVNPTKIVDMVTGKKKPQIIRNDEDNPLELLPEKRTKAPRKAPKDVSNDLTRNNSNSTTSDPPGSLFRSLSFLIDDLKLLNYSVDTIEQVNAPESSFEKAVHDLFIKDDEINGDDDYDGDRH
jgi:hypothetical protein